MLKKGTDFDKECFNEPPLGKGFERNVIYLRLLAGLSVNTQRVLKSVLKKKHDF